MTAAPALELPAPGAYIGRHDVSYVKRDSARRQAAHWNEALRDDPVFGPGSGYCVGVGEKVGRRWPLVWVPVHGYGMRPDGWAPGYCWCNHWAYDTARGPGCAGLGEALGLGRTPRSHEEAQTAARTLGMDYDDTLQPWRPRLAPRPFG